MNLMKICSVENCEEPKRTKYDPNEIIIRGNVCEMYLYDRHGTYLMSTFFDIEFLDKVKKHKWHSNKQGNTYYVITNIRSLFIRLKLDHLILPTKLPYEVDHKDHNGLNNRSSNLRRVTRRGNQENRRDNLSKYPGISWHKRDKIWQSSIQVNGKIIHLGYFDNLLDGFEARNKFKLEHNLV